MIRRLEIANYKIARRVDLHLDEFQVLVGPNGSGKSTVIDAIVFLSDLVRLGLEKTVRKRARSLEELTWNMGGGTVEFALEIDLPGPVIRRDKEFRACRYELSVGVSPSRNGLEVTAENLYLKETVGARPTRQLDLFPEDVEIRQPIIHHRSGKGWCLVCSKRKGPGYRYQYRAETTEWNFPYDVLKDTVGLQYVPADPERFYAGMYVRHLLADGTRRLHLNVERMRQPCPPDADARLSPDGSNIAMTVRALQERDPEAFREWVRHVLSFLPEFSDVQVREREEDRHLVLELVGHDHVVIPSWLLSDGTLRFLALTVLAYTPAENEVYLIEEPENGIHPSAIDGVHQSLSSAYGKQVVVATHNALFVGLTEPERLLCFGKTKKGAIDVVRGTEHPHLKDWKRTVDLGTLYASGVLD